MTGMVNILAVACGGALGCVCRWLVSQIPYFAVRATYWPTLTVNAVGCLIIGVMAALFSHFNNDGFWYRLAVTGFLGGFTTYSSFSLDAIRLWQCGDYMQTVCYVGLTLLSGFIACVLGLSVTERLLHSL